MKKLLLILAAIAYAAISCDKPDTLTGGDEPAVDTSADTCNIDIYYQHPFTAFLLYPNSPDEIDFEASIKSIFRHFTITLKDGSYGSEIYHNYREDYDQVSFDTGSLSALNTKGYINSLKYGSYCIVMLPATHGYGLNWGPNYDNPTQRFFYRGITLNEQHTFDSIILDEHYIDSIVDWFDPLWFEEF